MTDLGVLEMDDRGDLAKLTEADPGYSKVRRGSKTLYPIKTPDGVLYFSRRTDDNGASGNKAVLVDFSSI